MCHSEPGLLFAIAKDEADLAVHLVSRWGAILKMVPPQSHIIREVGCTGASPGEANHLCATVGLPVIVGSGAWVAVGVVRWIQVHTHEAVVDIGQHGGHDDIAFTIRLQNSWSPCMKVTARWLSCATWSGMLIWCAKLHARLWRRVAVHRLNRQLRVAMQHSFVLPLQLRRCCINVQCSMRTLSWSCHALSCCSTRLATSCCCDCKASLSSLAFLAVIRTFLVSLLISV